ncbi:putative LRR receptor-like serine/threonine-protein kinase [Nymphaea thermarum]|nr:putative LRR receptor-like serine/threonine-protein kinase [Nymphaea thermarum]
MSSQWDLYGFPLSWIFLVILVFHLKIQLCYSLNPEGAALLEFRARVDSDPYGVFSNWNPNDNSPCMWSGVHCRDGKVEKLDLSEFALGGILAPEIGKLSNLRSLYILLYFGSILYRNNFSGDIPKEIHKLTKLEVLDLRHNNLDGQIPAELRNLLSMKHALLCNHNFEDGLLPELRNLCIRLKVQSRQDFLGSSESYAHRHVEHLLPSVGRKLLAPNGPSAMAVPLPGNHTTANGTDTKSGNGKGQETTSGTKGSTPKSSPPSSPPSTPPIAQDEPPSTAPSSTPTSPTNKSGLGASKESQVKLIYAIVASAVAVVMVATIALFFMCRSQGVAAIGPFKTGLSGQLQKAFVTGAPKLNRPEVEAACEDFSNIIGTLSDCTIYKGTLSSGVEIAVTSPTATSSKDWSRCSEFYFRKKIDTLSRLNHKNFVNLLGYCIEEQPFTRIMVFEYAPNGTLYEHLHVKEVETLDWSTRMRIVMGVAYCLQFMHDLSPPIAHPSLYSKFIYLTDDFAAKLADFGYGEETTEKMKDSGDNDLHQMDWPYDNLESNIYNFGVLLLEIISGKLPYSPEQGFIVNWAIDYLNDKHSIGYMIDPILKTFKNKELDIICEVIQLCIHPDAKQRPSIKEITTKLKSVIEISPDAATPKLSPLWWAELQILST